MTDIAVAVPVGSEEDRFLLVYMVVLDIGRVLRTDPWLRQLGAKTLESR